MTINAFNSVMSGALHKDIAVPNHDFDYPIGLDYMDISNSANPRVKAVMDSPCGGTAKVHIDTWSNTKLNGAGAEWLEVSKHDRDFQCGVFSTRDDHAWNQPKVKTSRAISFAKPFAEPPQVVCWLKELDMDKNHNWRVKTYADNITKTGFTIHIETWGDSILYIGTTSWIAHPANRPNITSGSFNTMDVRAWNQPRDVTEGHVSYCKTFQKTPIVLAAYNHLDIDCNSNLRIKAFELGTKPNGFNWKIETWGGTTLYSAGLAYLSINEF